MMQGASVGHLSRLLEEELQKRRITERQAAERSGMPFESFRKILRGRTGRPRDRSLRQISDGLGVPFAVLARERARDAGEPLIDDISTTRALDIAIARVGDLRPEEVPGVRARLEELLRAMQQEERDEVDETG